VDGKGFEGKGLAFLHREIRRSDQRKRDSRPR
jgi:hypothetical protein